MGAVNLWAKNGVLEIEVHVMAGGLGVWGEGYTQLYFMLCDLELL